MFSNNAIASTIIMGFDYTINRMIKWVSDIIPGCGVAILRVPLPKIATGCQIYPTT